MFGSRNSDLTVTQYAVLKNAAKRQDRTILPLPDFFKLPAGARAKILAALENRGFIARTLAFDRTPGASPPASKQYTLTEAGLDACMDADRTNSNTARDQQAPQHAGIGHISADKSCNARFPRKQNIVIELLTRPGGATIREIRDATGWQKTSIHGFLSSTVRQKLGYRVLAERPAESRFRIITNPTDGNICDQESDEPNAGTGKDR